MSYFSLLVALGVAFGLWQVRRSAPERQAERWLDGGLGVLAGMLLGARLAYVALHQAYYAERLVEIFQFWEGGFIWWGAIPGGLTAAGLVALWWGAPLSQVLDGLTPLLPPLAVMSWLGCAVAGCGYGPELPAGSWYALLGLDEWGRSLPRFPLQYAAALLLLVYNGLVARFLPRRARPGLRAALTGLGLAMVQFAAARLSPEPAPAWNMLSYDEWAALILAVFSLGLGVAALLTKPQIRKNSYLESHTL